MRSMSPGTMPPSRLRATMAIVVRFMAAETSTASPRSAAASRPSAQRSASSCMMPARAAMASLWKAGCISRRCLRQKSPSAVSSPLPSMGRSSS